MQKKIFLFTETFPFRGGEPFLETEILFLAKTFSQVQIFSLNSNESKLVLPSNVNVAFIPESARISFSKFLIQNLSVYFHWFFSEIIKSPKRWNYIKNFKQQLYRLTGLIKKANDLNGFIKSDINEFSRFYSYWFNDWGTILSILKFKNKKINFVTRVHLFDFEEEFHSSNFIPFRYTEISKPKQIMPISNYATQYLLKKYIISCPSNYLGVIYNGNNEINNNGKLTIVSCSSLSWYKRPLLLVQLMSKIKLNIKWVHFGDGDMKNEFLEYSKKLPSNIEFIFKGFVPNSDIIEFYKTNSVNVVLNVSSFEGIPVSLMEAISFGIPIIGCNVCGMPEIINEQTGILLDKDFEIEKAAIKISEFLIQKSLNIEYRKKVKEFWFKNFNADVNYPNFIKNHLVN
ncbi:MAG: glycosyltransferase [Bacteroidetes bacterium]|nr:glycosyltransferase [Bacteroidota bacterium]